MRHTPSAASCCPCWTWCLKGGPRQPSASPIHGWRPRGQPHTPPPSILWTDKLSLKILGLKTHSKQTHSCLPDHETASCLHPPVVALWGDTHIHYYNKKRDCCRGLVLIWITLVFEGTLGSLPIFMTSLLHGCAGLFFFYLILALSLQHIIIC